MHHIDIYLDKWSNFDQKNQNSLGIGYKKLGISTENDRERIKNNKKMHKS